MVDVFEDILFMLLEFVPEFANGLKFFQFWVLALKREMA